MFDSINRKRALQVLVVVILASTVLAGIILTAQFRSSGFSLFSNNASFKNNVDEEKTSSVEGVQAIIVKTSSESINIIPDTSAGIRAHFYGSYGSSDKTFKPRLVVEREGDSLVIRIDNGPKKPMLTFMSNIKLDVYIPETFDKKLEITSTSGEVTSRDQKLDSFHVVTTSGRIAIKSADASAAVFRSTSGEINFEGSIKELDIGSTSGLIVSEKIISNTVLANSTSGEIKLKGSIEGITAVSTSGTVIIDTDRLTKDMAVTTTSGEIYLKLPADAGFILGAKSVSGEINCAFPVTVTGNSHRNILNGTVGNGECNISLSSTSGNINIAK